MLLFPIWEIGRLDPGDPLGGPADEGGEDVGGLEGAEEEEHRLYHVRGVEPVGVRGPCGPTPLLFPNPSCRGEGGAVRPFGNPITGGWLNNVVWVKFHRVNINPWLSHGEGGGGKRTAMRVGKDAPWI